MGKTETLIRAILGITHEKLRPLVFTADEAAEQMLHHETRKPLQIQPKPLYYTLIKKCIKHILSRKARQCLHDRCKAVFPELKISFQSVNRIKTQSLQGLAFW